MNHDQADQQLIETDDAATAQVASGSNTKVWHLYGFTVAVFSQNIAEVSS